MNLFTHSPMRFITATAAIAGLVAACSSNSAPSSAPSTSGAPAPVNVALAAQPSGTATLTWDPQTKNVTAKLQMAGFTPGSGHAMHIHQGGCAALGDVVVPFPDVTADGGGAINTTVTSLRPAPAGLVGGTSLNMHLASSAQLGGPGALGFTPIACADLAPAAPGTATVTMAPVGPAPQGSANVTYDPQKKTLTVTTTASGLPPGSGHAQHIHLGTCNAQGAVKYPLNDLLASPAGSAQTITVVQNAEAPPASGWYLNIHDGSSSQIQQNGQPTLYFQPIICGNIGK